MCLISARDAAGGFGHIAAPSTSHYVPKCAQASGPIWNDSCHAALTQPMPWQPCPPPLHAHGHTHFAVHRGAVPQIVQQYMSIMGEKMEEPLGTTLVELDGRFSTVRRAESNLGNLVADVWRKAAGADIAILNGGSLRSDMIHPPGLMRVKDMVAVLPMVDETVVLEVTGEQVLRALENGVSAWPTLEGRFPQVREGMREGARECVAGARPCPRARACLLLSAGACWWRWCWACGRVSWGARGGAQVESICLPAMHAGRRSLKCAGAASTCHAHGLLACVCAPPCA